MIFARVCSVVELRLRDFFASSQGTNDAEKIDITNESCCALITLFSVKVSN